MQCIENGEAKQNIGDKTAVKKIKKTNKICIKS